MREFSAQCCQRRPAFQHEVGMLLSTFGGFRNQNATLTIKPCLDIMDCTHPSQPLRQLVPHKFIAGALLLTVVRDGFQGLFLQAVLGQTPYMSMLRLSLYMRAHESATGGKRFRKTLLAMWELMTLSLVLVDTVLTPFTLAWPSSRSTPFRSTTFFQATGETKVLFWHSRRRLWKHHFSSLQAS